MSDVSAPTIRSVSARAVLAPLPRPITTAVARIDQAPLVLVDVQTDRDVVGRSYLFGYTPAALKPMVAAVEAVGGLIEGRAVAPAARMADLSAAFRLLGRQGAMGMAMSGVEMALWDALGRIAGKPVAQLLGGEIRAIPAYESFGVFDPETDPPALEAALEAGVRAVKFRLGSGDLARDLSDLAAIRDLIGPDVRLMVDYNQALCTPEAIRRISRFEPFDLDWVEEPVAAEDLLGHAAVRAAVTTPIQTGENWWFPYGAATAIALGACDHAMPDLGKIGGIGGWREAAAMARGAAIPVSSHLYIEASAHVLAVTPGAYRLEYLDAAGALLTERFTLKNGGATPRGPGLGIDWDEDAVARALV